MRKSHELQTHLIFYLITKQTICWTQSQNESSIWSTRMLSQWFRTLLMNCNIKGEQRQQENIMLVPTGCFLSLDRPWLWFHAYLSLSTFVSMIFYRTLRGKFTISFCKKAICQRFCCITNCFKEQEWRDTWMIKKILMQIYVIKESRILPNIKFFIYRDYIRITP